MSTPIAASPHCELTNNIQQTSTPSDPASLYLDSLGSPQSRRVIESRLHRFSRILHAKDWHSIPWHEMDSAWLLLAKEELTFDQCSPQTINAMLSMLKSLAAYAWKLKLISDQTYLRMKNTKVICGGHTPQHRSLDKNDFIKLLNACLNDDRLQGLRDATLLALLYGCGLRRSEIISIDMVHIDAQERAIRVIGKGKKERMAYPPEHAWELMQQWIAIGRGNQPGPLFCRIRKNDRLTLDRLTDQAVYYIIQRLITLAGVDSFSPNDLRRSFITWLLSEGEDAYTVADIAGHADVRSTISYTSFSEIRRSRVNRAIDF